MKNVAIYLATTAFSALVFLALRAPGAPSASHGEGHAPSAPSHSHGYEQAPSAESPEPPAAAGESIVYWACPSSPERGVSWEGTCPLDGKALERRVLPASTVHDLANTSCPICGMETREELFGIYRDKKVRLGCRACDEEFLEQPEAIVRRVEASGAGDHP